MTKEEWTRVEAELRNPYTTGVVLLADGHELKLRVEREKGLKFTIVCYVDGWMRGEWSKPDSEVGAKFWRRQTVHVFSPAKLRQMAKGHGKCFAASMAKRFPPGHFYSPGWPNAAALRRHLAKTCTSVQLVSCGYVPAAGGAAP